MLYVILVCLVYTVIYFVFVICVCVLTIFLTVVVLHLYLRSEVKPAVAMPAWVSIAR